MSPPVVHSEGPLGGKPPREGGGGSFNEKFTGIKQIRITHAHDSISSMKIEYDDNGKSVWCDHGTSAGPDFTIITLAISDEYLISVSGTYGNWNSFTVITSLTFKSNKRTFGPFGAAIGTNFSYTPSNGKMVGFHGIYGAKLDSLGAYWTPLEPINPKPSPTPEPIKPKPSPIIHSEAPVGGKPPKEGGGGSFDETYTGINHIRIVYDDNNINSMKIEYDDNGKSVWSGDHGLSVYGPNIDLITLSIPEEYLISVTGCIGKWGDSTVITSLTFKSNKRTFGPFGALTGTKFSFTPLSGKIVGFMGIYGSKLDSIGVYWTPLEPIVPKPIPTPEPINPKPSPTPEPINPKPSLIIIHSETPVGGKPPNEGGGGSFDEKYTGIKHIRIAYDDDNINSMKIEYDDNGKSVWSGDHGLSVNGPKINLITLSFPDEYLISVTGFIGKWGENIVITSLTFTSNKRTFGPFGASTGTKFSFPPSTGKIVGFRGIYGTKLDSIGVYWTPISPIPSPEIPKKKGSYAWNDGVHTFVKKIEVHYGSVINSIRFEYDSHEGCFFSSKHRGQPKGASHTIELAVPDEYLVCVFGFIADGPSPKAIQSLTFVSNWRKYERIGGAETGNFFVLPQTGGKITGFFGKAGSHLESLGAYSVPTPRNYLPIGPFGGSGGNNWDDGHYHGVRKIKVFVKDFIQCLQIEYATSSSEFVWSDEHGSSKGGDKFEFALDYPRELLLSISGSYDPSKPGKHINSITFKSNKKNYGPFGSEDGVQFLISATKTKIIGFYGTKDTYLGSLGAHVIPIAENGEPDTTSKPEPDTGCTSNPHPDTTKPKPKPTLKLVGPFGGKGGRVWDDGVYDAVNKINIAYDETDGAIEYINFEYNKDGHAVVSIPHGTYQSGETAEITIDGKDEYLVSVEGYSNAIAGFPTPLIQSLAFKTNKKTYGPYGPKKGTKFLLGNDNSRILGFSGSSGQYLDSIGAHIIEK